MQIKMSIESRATPYLTSINSLTDRHIARPTSFATCSLALLPCHNSLAIYFTSSTSTYKKNRNKNKRQKNFNLVIFYSKYNNQKYVDIPTKNLYKKLNLCTIYKETLGLVLVHVFVWSINHTYALC